MHKGVDLSLFKIRLIYKNVWVLEINMLYIISYSQHFNMHQPLHHITINGKVRATRCLLNLSPSTKLTLQWFLGEQGGSAWTDAQMHTQNFVESEVKWNKYSLLFTNVLIALTCPSPACTLL